MSAPRSRIPIDRPQEGLNRAFAGTVIKSENFNRTIFMKTVLALAALGTLLCVTAMAQETTKPASARPLLPPTLDLGPPVKYTAEELADRVSRQALGTKGPVGQIDGNFFVSLVAGGMNEIDCPDGTVWTGLKVGEKQVVFIFRKRLCLPANLPPDFTLPESILVSFEGPVVRILDFRNFSGGVFLRNAPDK